jgi:hypothetical protein
MKHSISLTTSLAILSGLAFCQGGCAVAQNDAPQGPNLSTPVATANLDAAAYAEWESGHETAIAGDGSAKDRQPGWVLWNGTNPVYHTGRRFGDSKMPGVRHLRIGFKAPVAIGSVLARGGGSLSVLKPGAAYPGAVDDESQWVPAERLVSGAPSREEVGNDEVAVWTLPPHTQTRALRFTHTASPTDNGYAGYLGGAFAMSERFANLARLGTALSGSNNQKAQLLNNGAEDGWGAWENDPQGDAPVISAQNPGWVMLVWPSPVRLSGVLGVWAGFGAADVQAYIGPDDRHPRDADETDWQTVGRYSGLKNGYPSRLWPNRLDFEKEVTTRAIRLRMTGVSNEGHPHLKGRTKDGHRVWLGELLALQDLGEAALQPVKRTPEANAPHPPIPVRFHLDKPGTVTLVIEDQSGRRVRNLVAETFFPAGDNVAWWDGTDDLGRDIDAARHGLYKIPARFVPPGAYRARGLVRDAIGLHYEFSVYTAGHPAWQTPDGTGGWLSNHTPPQAAAFVPAETSPTGQPAIYIGSYVSEGTDGLAWVDLEGHKLGGQRWVGGTWTGAPYLARDAGSQAVAGVAVYVGAAWQGELRLTAILSKGGDKPMLSSVWKFPVAPGAKPEEINAASVMTGLAAYNGVLVASLPKQEELLFVDAKAGKVLGSSKLADARGLAFDAKGRLFILAGTKLLCFDDVSTPAALPAPQTVIESGLQDPRGIALDASGDIYISDRGESHQVKVFSSEGKYLRAIGKPGVPKAGAYDPLHMNNPDGLAIDARNQLWVAENDFLPKRVSVWSLDGKLLRAFYGPGKYGGGGTVDSSDKARFYYADEARGTLEFKLDWQKGDFQLADVLYRQTPDSLKLAFRSAAPETPIDFDGRRYFTNCYNSSPTSGHGTAFIFLEKNGVAQPVAAAGRANDWDVLKGDAFKASWPPGADLNGDLWRNGGRNQVFFLWSDANGDANVQPNEVQWQQASSGGVTVMPDLSFVVSRLDGVATQFAPGGFTASGAPRYELGGGKVLARDVARPASSGGDQVLAGEGGWTIATLGMAPFHQYSLSGAKDGVPTWSYPNLWPGLHASHEAAKPDRPGEVIGATRLLGGFIKPHGSDAGQIWGVNGNMGDMYLFTSDGLFVAQLFEDVRQGQRWKMPLAQRDMKLEGITLHDENFWPTLSQTPDGKVYLVDGANTSIVRVDGLDSIKRLPATPLTVSAADLKAAQEYVIQAEAARQQSEGRGVLAVALRSAAPVVDGKLDDWAGASWVDIDKSGVGANFNSNSRPYDISAAVAVAGDKLYAAFRAGDGKLLQNSGEMPTAPFKTGGALDLMIGTDPGANPKRSTPVAGDLRLLVTTVKGKTLAVLYRAVAPGTQNPVPFSSPWRTVTIDKVEDVSTQVQLAGKDGNYEFSIPLETLGLKPVDGLKLQGDVGVLRGDGTQTTARVYWSNKATGITADVPSEAQLTPQLWGAWEFKTRK